MINITLTLTLAMRNENHYISCYLQNKQALMRPLFHDIRFIFERIIIGDFNIICKNY